MIEYKQTLKCEDSMDKDTDTIREFVVPSFFLLECPTEIIISSICYSAGG